MGKRIRGLNITARLVYIIVFALSAAVFWTTRSGSGWTDLILNGIFDLIAAVVLIAYFAGCVRPMVKMTRALEDVTGTIRNRAAASDPKTLWSELGREKLFAGTALAARWSAYVKTVKRQTRANPATADCDIADYIDEDLLASVGKKHFCDQISGIMTGLGILFTFIGLVYGLRSFNAASVELMQESTQILMAGIKVAFLTSIFGLIYSLIFTLFYRRTVRLATEALYSFQDCFDECVRPNSAHAGENALIRLQAEQNELLETLAGTIGSSVSESLSASIRPVIDDLSRTLQGYVTVSIEDQKSGMDKVVTYFLENMNRSLGNIFDQLRAQTEELNRWQQTMISGMQKFMAGVAGAQGDLEQSRKYTQLIIERVENFTASTEGLVARQMDSLRQIESFMNDYQALHKAEKAYIMEMAAAAKNAEASSEKSLEAAEAIGRMSGSFLDTMDQKTGELFNKLHAQLSVLGEDQRSSAEITHRHLESAGERLAEAAGALTMVAEKNSTDMTLASEKLSDSLNGSFDRFDRQLSTLEQSLAKLRVASESVDKSLQALPASASALDADLNKTAKTLKSEFSALLSALTDTRRALEKFSSDASRRLNR